jgi:adenylate kinase family enzyme
MLHVDLIGLPGSGKTTLLDKIKREKDVFNIDDIRYIKLKGINSFFKTQIFKIFMYYFPREEKMLKNVFFEKELLNDAYRELFNLTDCGNINKLQLDPVLRRCLFLTHLIKWTKNNFNQNCVILVDESLFHHLNCEQLKFVLENRGYFKDIIPDLIVNVDENSDLIVKRLRVRRKKLEMFSALSEIEIYTKLEGIRAAINEKIFYFQEMGLDVINFSHNQNQELLKEFNKKAI